MFNFIIGCIIGFVVATIGVANVVNMLDDGVNQAKEQIESIQK